MRTQQRKSDLHAARLLLCLIVVLTMMGALPAPGQAAGIITHADIVGLAIAGLYDAGYHDFAGQLATYVGAVRYGSMFPDIGSGISATTGEKKFDDWGEFIHDTDGVRHGGNTPFRSALMRQMSPLYRTPTAEDDRKEIAFLFGFICHQEADNPWHFPNPLDASPPAAGVPLGLQPYYATTRAVDHLPFELGVDRYIFFTGIGTQDYAPEWFLPEELKGLISTASTAAGTPIPRLRWPLASPSAVLGEGLLVQQAQFFGEAASSVLWSGDLQAPLGSPQYYEYMHKLWNSRPGGLYDGAEHCVEAWKQTLKWFDTEAPCAAMDISAEAPNGCYRGLVLTSPKN